VDLWYDTIFPSMDILYVVISIVIVVVVVVAYLGQDNSGDWKIDESIMRKGWARLYEKTATVISSFREGAEAETKSETKPEDKPSETKTEDKTVEVPPPSTTEFKRTEDTGPKADAPPSVFGSDTVGSEVMDQIASQAFMLDYNQVQAKTRLQENSAVRPPEAETLFQDTTNFDNYGRPTGAMADVFVKTSNMSSRNIGNTFEGGGLFGEE
jgi:hypothetical protein